MGLCHSRKASSTHDLSIKPHKRSAAVGGFVGSNKWRRIRPSRNEEVVVIQDPTPLAAAILFRQQMQNNGCSGALAAIDRTASLRYPAKKKNQSSARSSSSRDRSITDPLLHPRQLLNKDIKLDDVETNHYVLVHGGGFGAWCWYKTISLLEGTGFKVTAIDLTGSGLNSFDTNSITSLAQYVKPLTDFFEALPDGEKVILVGHDFGGACISYAMELFPTKVSKAVFIAATMLTSGQSTLDMLSQKTDSNDLMMQEAQIFIYANGKNNPPTAFDLNKSLLRDLLFNHSPAKDAALASVLMRPIPFSPVLEKISLSDLKYGSIRRFYVETLEDNAIPIELQRSMINQSHIEKVFPLKGSDHSPFFSKPQALHKILVEISTIP
ncbi:unnamed protein product [Cuscuta epithymum]|uniref:AB hydrolase-1 domain-containing protein n=1 Tax=Cuscuta epithymum TaxID=186058 RepID=A0AAV0G526_9ASTE|nr:unnamed protein product [Cuscuta epithymum]CAH9118759.1 unnamed protein product [Cuscuta epithymum]CAH9143035.1 unnamed protein product [Cuscuta epithymum]